MIAKLPAKVASWLTLGFVAAGISGSAASTAACGETGACSFLRQTEYANLETWQACDPASTEVNQCIVEAGNPKDCTGVLSCNFAINAHFRADAEMAVYNSGQASQGCYLCATPSCIAVEMAVCEPISRRCIGVSGTTSNGGLIFGGEDAGGTSSDGAAPAPTPTGDGG